MGQANRKSKDPAVRRQMAIERDRLAAMTPEDREAEAEQQRAASLRRSNGRGVLAVAMAFASIFASIFASGSQRCRR